MVGGLLYLKIKTRDMILVALFSALMAVGAYIKILFPLVPLSFQPFFCAFAGIILGSKLGALSQIIYTIIGLIGIPVFTQGGGVGYVLKPSFGFILGFIACAYVIGKVSETLKTISLKNSLISVMSGLAVMNIIGVTYLYLIAKFYLGNSEMTLWDAISTGLLPFILKDIILYIVVAITATAVLPILKKAGLAVR